MGSSSVREDAGGKPARPEADVPLLQKSDRRKLLLQLCEHTASGRGLGAGGRRRSRHAPIKKIIKNLRLPSDITFGALIRNGVPMLVDGETLIEPYDQVVVFFLNRSMKNIENLFN